MAALNTIVVRDSATIRDSILRVLRNALIARGIPNPNVTPGSDYYVLAQAVANELTVAEANVLLKADAVLPDTAVDADLARICAIFGLSKQAAAGSVGSVVLDTAATSNTIATGATLIDGAGLSYQVTTGGIYADGASIPIAAISTGKDTNHESGDILRWVSTPPQANEKAEVGAPGLVNGIDAEDDEVLRGRLLAFLQGAPRSGNAEHVNEIAEASTPSVQKSFCHPAILGPSTYGVVVVAAPTSTNKSRDVATVTVNGTVIPYILGQLPEHAYGAITSVTNVDADVAFGLSLPESPTAAPPGPGGGWLDGTPWPAPDAATTWKCAVTGVTSTTVFTVDATRSPMANVSHIAWLSPFEWKLYTALVTAVSGTSGSFTITLDQPFVGIASGCFIWPGAQNAQSYVDAVLAQFALMGPGEKTANPSALTRAFRHPRPAAGWPTTLGAHLERAITTAQTEVQAAEFLYRSDGTTLLNGPSGTVTPQVPISLLTPPNIYRPRHIAFYRIP